MRQTTTVEVRLDHGKAKSFSAPKPTRPPFRLLPDGPRANFVAARLPGTEDHIRQTRNPGSVGWNVPLSEHLTSHLPARGLALALSLRLPVLPNLGALLRMLAQAGSRRSAEMLGIFFLESKAARYADGFFFFVMEEGYG
jgi:hypothetical protein